MVQQTIDTPLGPMIAVADDRALLLLEFADRYSLKRQFSSLEQVVRGTPVEGTSETIERLRQELTDYFEGNLSTFTTPVVLQGTPFQMAVWNRLQQIPYGTTTSYGDLSKGLGNVDATRAVARANGDNRIAILIPCHRVIGANGSMTGYGGGIWRKQALLDLESRQPSLFKR